jgi:hypothetical protein
MKTKFLTLSMIALLAITSISCSKNDDPVAPVVPIVPVAANGFTWTQNGNTTVLTVDNPYVNGQFKSIFAVRAGVTIYEINLTAITPGTYALGGTSSNSLFYNNTGASTSFSPTSGSVIITANVNNKLTGTFTATGTGDGTTSVSGSFTNITIN